MADRFAAIYEQFIEWVYDRSTDTALGDVDFSKFSTEHELDSSDSFSLLRYCKDRGLLDDKHSTHGGPAANITAEGRDWVEARRQRRADPMFRTAAARKGLLDWLWGEKQSNRHASIIERFIDTERATVEGERLHPREIDRAAAYLQEKGYIKGIRTSGRQGPIRAEITAKGEDCVEQFGGDVTEYERHQRGGDTVINIGANNTGNIAANNRDVTQDAKTVNGTNMADIVLLARALRQATSQLGLSEDDTAELVETANRIEQEASRDDPDVGRFQRWRATVISLLSQTTTGALGGVLATYSQQVLPALPPS